MADDKKDLITSKSTGSKAFKIGFIFIALLITTFVSLRASYTYTDKCTRNTKVYQFTLYESYIFRENQSLEYFAVDDTSKVSRKIEEKGSELKVTIDGKNYEEANNVDSDIYNMAMEMAAQKNF